MRDSIIYGIVWAGLCMLFDYSMWVGGIMEWYHDWLEESQYRIVNAFGLCMPCFGFWFGILFWYETCVSNYIVFLGISQLILITYTIIMESLFGKK